MTRKTERCACPVSGMRNLEQIPSAFDKRRREKPVLHPKYRVITNIIPNILSTLILNAFATYDLTMVFSVNTSLIQHNYNEEYYKSQRLFKRNLTSLRPSRGVPPPPSRGIPWDAGAGRFGRLRPFPNLPAAYEGGHRGRSWKRGAERGDRGRRGGGVANIRTANA